MRFILLTFASLCCVGCSEFPLTSKWGMDDLDYRAKYSKPYSDEPLDKPLRMLKQSVDARHVGGKSGNFAQFAGASAPITGSAAIGGFQYDETGSVESYVSLMGLAGAGRSLWFAGLNPGILLQTPTRLAPFIGAGTYVGTYVGAHWSDRDNDSDGKDNNGNGVIDDPLETGDETKVDGFAAIYPEVGIHYWLGSRARLTLSASYWLTTAGRSDDFAFYGVSLGFLTSSSPGDEERPRSIPVEQPAFAPGIDALVARSLALLSSLARLTGIPTTTRL